MTTILTGQLQQYTQDNCNNTHKTTTTIHTRQLQQLHTRQLKTSNNTHDTNYNTTCTEGTNTQARQYWVQFIVTVLFFQSLNVHGYSVNSSQLSSGRTAQHLVRFHELAGIRSDRQTLRFCLYANQFRHSFVSALLTNGTTGSCNKEPVNSPPESVVKSLQHNGDT